MEHRGPEFPARGKPNGNFCWQQNELYDLFQPIIGSTSHAVYTHLTRRAFESTFRCSARELGRKTGLSHAAVSRAFAVLERIGLLRVSTGGGNSASEITLIDLEALAKKLGATRDRRTGEFTFPEQTKDRLREEVLATRRKSQGKTNTSGMARQQTCTPSGFDLDALISSVAFERDTSGTPERHQRCPAETQMRQQIKENRKQENKNLSPTPFPLAESLAELWKGKNVPDERKAELSLKRARDLFCGVMANLKDHLVNHDRPRLPHLEDGYKDWRRFGFDSLGVMDAIEAQGRVRLVLCASDAAAAQTGLVKYRKTWDAATLRWFGCEVEIVWLPAGDG